MRDIFALQLYTRVARLGSFSAAARECGVSQPQASRIVAELEASLDARLLSRTTRAVRLTEAGAEYLARIEPVLAAIEEAESSVREGSELRGVLRVGMPASFGIRVLLPRLSRFVDNHPKLNVQVLLEDRMQDMVREAVDVGIRVGSIPDASGTSKLLGRIPRVVVASPAYLKRAGTPKTPVDLGAHRIIGGPASSHPTAWKFERDGKTTSVTLAANVTINDTSGAVAAAAGHLGITSTTAWACAQELAAGLLVPVLTKWKMADIPVHAFFPQGRATRKSARMFVDFLADEIHARPV